MQKFNPSDYLVRRLLGASEFGQAQNPAAGTLPPDTDAAQTVAARLSTPEGRDQRPVADAVLQFLQECGLREAVNTAVNRQRAFVNAGGEPLDWTLVALVPQRRRAEGWEHEAMPYPRACSRRLDDPLAVLQKTLPDKLPEAMVWLVWHQRRDGVHPVLFACDGRARRAAWVIGPTGRWYSILAPDLGIAQLFREDVGAGGFEEQAVQALLHTLGQDPAPTVRFHHGDELFLTLLWVVQELQNAAVKTFFGVCRQRG